MAEEVWHFTATIPAGTPVAAPVTVAITMPVRTVRRVDWRVPNGPMGTMGWLLAMGGVAVMPQPPGTYVVANDEHGTWQIDDGPDGGTWQVAGYNTGTNAHSVYLAFHADPVTRPPAVPAPIPPWQLMPAPDLSRAGPPVAGR